MNLIFTGWLRTQIQWSYKSTLQRLATDTQVDTDIPTTLLQVSMGSLIWEAVGVHSCPQPHWWGLRVRVHSLKCHLAISGENLGCRTSGATAANSSPARGRHLWGRHWATMKAPSSRLASLKSLYAPRHGTTCHVHIPKTLTEQPAQDSERSNQLHSAPSAQQSGPSTWTSIPVLGLCGRKENTDVDP